MSEASSHISSHISNVVRSMRMDVSDENPWGNDIMDEENLLVESESGLESDYENIGNDGRSTYRLRNEQKQFEDYVQLVAQFGMDIDLPTDTLFQEMMNITPKAKVHSYTEIKETAIKLCNEMKVKLQEILLQLSSRASLSTNIWKSVDRNKRYCCLTCHYIDNDWALNKKMIAYKIVRDEDEVHNLSGIVKSQAMSWNIESNLFNVVIDDAVNNDGEMVLNLKEWFNLREALPLNGQLFPMFCSVRILSSIVQDGFQVVDELLRKIRSSIRYSHANYEMFANALAAAGFARIYVPVDERIWSSTTTWWSTTTRWSTTYDMLKKAVEVHIAFVRLAELHPHEESLASREEWELGKVVCDFFKVFYETLLQFSRVEYPTTNECFKGIFNVYKSILKWESNEHDCVRELAYKAKVILDTYWSQCSLMMSIGMVFDPRYKMVFVKYAFNVIYGSESQTYITKVFQSLSELYSSYKMHFPDATKKVAKDETEEEYQSFLKEQYGDVQVHKSELENYLEEDLFPRDVSNFDILLWWKATAPKYPILARMARDILAVPGFSVTPDSVFTIGDKVIAQNRSSLAPDLVEALACMKDWLPPIPSTLSTEQIIWTGSFL